VGGATVAAPRRFGSTELKPLHVWLHVVRGTDHSHMQTFPHDGMDESWLAEWVAFGFREMEAYLRRQAAFDAY